MTTVEKIENQMYEIWKWLSNQSFPVRDIICTVCFTWIYSSLISDGSEFTQTNNFIPQQV